MQVVDIRQFTASSLEREARYITATSSQFEQRIGAKRNPCCRWAKRLRLSGAWANPLKRFEISVRLCKPKDWVYLKVTGVNEVLQTGVHLTL